MGELLHPSLPRLLETGSRSKESRGQGGTKCSLYFEGDAVYLGLAFTPDCHTNITPILKQKKEKDVPEATRQALLATKMAAKGGVRGTKRPAEEETDVVAETLAETQVADVN